MAVMDVRGLSVGIKGRGGGKLLVRDMNLTLERGRIFGLVGQSGAGKTTTANALAGLLARPVEITRGKIFINGEEFPHRNRKAWARVRGRSLFMIFQSAGQALNPSLTVGRQIREVMDGASQLNDFLDPVGLDHKVKGMYPFQLSGGMRQRVQIAIALALKPDILIADEPTTGLDPITRLEILNLLSGLKESPGMAILFISHDLGAVGRIADRVGVMHGGRMVEEGSVGNIFLSPQREYTRKLLEKFAEMEEATWKSLC